MVPISEILHVCENTQNRCFQGNVADTSFGIKHVRNFCQDSLVLSHREIFQLMFELDDMNDWIASVISHDLLTLAQEYDDFTCYQA